MDSILYLDNILNSSNPMLFLGAGFSLGAKTFNGNAMPNGTELKNIILKDFLKYNEEQNEYDELNKLKLADVCQFCANTQGSSKINDYLCYIFKNTQPADFHYHITEYKWKKIYTTNIDDIIEKIYASRGLDIVAQNLKRKNTISTFDKLEYIKLHGCVNNPSEGIVFSSSEYINSITNTLDYRFNSLSLDIYNEDFIFIGSNYDEFNINYFLELYKNAGYDSSRGRLIFINPSPTMFFESQIKLVNGVLIKWTTKQFLEHIKLRAHEASTALVINNISEHGFQDLGVLRDKFKSNAHYTSKLYEGFEPAWYDIFSDKDFIDHRIITEFDHFYSANERYNVGIFSIYGKAYIGKTAAILRLGAKLFDMGFKVFKFIGRELICDSFLNYVKRSEIDHFAVLFDNASYNYGPIKHLYKVFPKNKKLIIITTSRPIYHISKRYNLIEANFYEVKIEDSIDLEYSKEIQFKLDKNGFLGELKKFNYNQQIEYIHSNNDIMSLIFKLTFGTGFYKRIKKDLTPMLNEISYEHDFLINLAIFDKIDLPFFPKELLALLYGKDAEKLLIKIENFIKKTLNNDLKLRSDFFVRNILDSASSEKLAKNIKEILIYISPQIDENSHSYWNEIQSYLTKEKVLRKQLRIKELDIQKLYDDIRNYYSDNYNYWIQLGKFEQRAHEYEKALNHFKQAEALRPNSYMVQHSIGGNYLKQANSISEYSKAEVYFKEGETILLKHIKEREEYSVRAYSTHCYLFEKIKFIRTHHINVNDIELHEMFHYLELLINKDPSDILAQQISNYFYNYLKSIKRTNIIKINHYDLSKYQYLFKSYKLDIEDLLDDIED